ncbi:TRAP transporter small permease [Chengkuizengella axinellae]|uniref:TRAP transporter small permease n=1 Tax=Chengkuizengella axinellae TaxID=3064388 RepID=A0ABT9J4I2_9BACL|nr:TRAP transporter small permease [Chengkuizengella sp. 2205SS18-9]MDP5276504.1 TRAP transporter small permease [Chengkuizengella sp. 2205SS18-9]
MKKIDTLLNHIEEIIVSITLALGVSITFFEIILRIFNATLGFSFEASIYLLITCGLIGASIGVRDKVHIGIDIIVKQFPTLIQKMIGVGALSLCTLFCIIITILGIQHIQILYDFGQVTPEMEIPVYIPKSIIPIAFGLMSIRFLQTLIRYVKKPIHQLRQQEVGEDL